MQALTMKSDKSSTKNKNDDVVLGVAAADDEHSSSCTEDNESEDFVKLFSSKKKKRTKYEIQIKRAARNLLLKRGGIIPMDHLKRTFDLDAANLLVEDCLLVFLEGLFNEDRKERDGFVKDVPEKIGLLFAGQLAKYDVLLESYMKTLTIPYVIKTSLSSNGLEFLLGTSFYKKLLAPTSTEYCYDDQNNECGNEELKKSDDSSTRNTPNDLSVTQETTIRQGMNVNLETMALYRNPHSTTMNEQSTKFIIVDSSREHVVEACSNQNQAVIDRDYVDLFFVDQDASLMTARSVHENNIIISSTNHPNSLFEPCMDWNKLRSTFVGLINGGSNSCYINSVLQCLASTPPLVIWLLSESKNLCTCDVSNRGGFCSICELTRIILSMNSTSDETGQSKDQDGVQSAEHVRNHVFLFSPSLCPGRQEDASVFLISFLDHCINSLTLNKSALPIPERPSTAIDRIFSIKFLSSIECSKCSNVSHQEEATFILPVEIDNLNNLLEAFEHFFGRETLTGVNAYQCSRCNQLVTAYKYLTIDELSPILIISLKRGNSYRTNTVKLQHRVDYPEYLDLSSHMHSPMKNTNNINSNDMLFNNIYRLYAVVSHSGQTLNSGHYYSYARASNDRWFKFDDEKFESVLPSDVFNEKDAFILFYAKVSEKSKTFNMMIGNTGLPSISTVRNEQIQSSSFTTFSIKKKPMSFDGEPFQFLNESLSSSNVTCNEQTSQQCHHPVQTYDQNPRKRKRMPSNFSFDSDDSLPVITGPKPLPGYTESSITIGNICSKDNLTKQPTCVMSIDTQKIRNSHSSNDVDDQSNEMLETSCHESVRIKNVLETSQTMASVAAGVPIEKVFEEVLPSTYQFRLTPAQLLRMNQIRKTEIEKKSKRKLEKMGLLPSNQASQVKLKCRPDSSSVDASKKRKEIHKEIKSVAVRNVNIEYFDIVQPHLKHYTSSCGLCISTRYFGTDASDPAKLLVRCNLHCNASLCPFKCVVYIFNNGNCIVNAKERKICHLVTERISRPIRGIKRKEIIEKFKAGGTVHRIHAEYDAKRTNKEKQGFNYDSTGKSKRIFKKIKHEATSEGLLSKDSALGIVHLHDQLREQINHEGVIPGAIQLIQIRPFCTVMFTEASVRLYDSIVAKPHAVLSWDATGGIIKSGGASNSKQCLYYELTVSHPNIVDEDSLVPLTFMLSESQTLRTVLNWLITFKDAYRKIFPHKKDSFPRPAIVLSDRAQVFLQASLQIYNDETYKQFLARAYRIVNNRALKDDLSKTNIHACLAHFMLDMRKLVNKYLPIELRELGMWCIALLVNTNTWSVMKDNWQLICCVFLNYSSDNRFNASHQHALLLSRIDQITDDPNVCSAIEKSKITTSMMTEIKSTDVYDFNDDDVDDNDEEQSSIQTNQTKSQTTVKRQFSKQTATSSPKNKKMIDEEKQLNEMDSPFKRDLQQIYHQCYESLVKTSGSVLSNDKIVKSIRQWLSYLNRN